MVSHISMVSSAKTGEGFLCTQHSYATTNIAGERLDIFESCQFDLAVAGNSREGF